jgi:hypothetical protein
VIQSVITSRATPHKIRRASIDRDDQINGLEFVDDNGVPIVNKSFTTEFINFYSQPLGKQKSSSNAEGERIAYDRIGWTVEGIRLKDRVSINGFFFSVEEAEPWPEFTEVSLVATGEADKEEDA